MATSFLFYFSKVPVRTSLAVQWLGCRTSTAGGAGLIPGGELRSCMPRGVVLKKKKKKKGTSPQRIGKNKEKFSLAIYNLRGAALGGTNVNSG